MERDTKGGWEGSMQKGDWKERMENEDGEIGWERRMWKGGWGGIERENG